MRQKIITEGDPPTKVYILIEGECMMTVEESPMKRLLPPYIFQTVYLPLLQLRRQNTKEFS